ncbi:type II toxin-antitoxin system MqsA family antitoxin [Alcanivorax sp. MM125-6]|nr:type II toxin-antitoxin system MqsA family antitoxin [Alcanivorax sp. MM125-6]
METMCCGVCGEEALRAREETSTLTAGDISGDVLVRFTECEACGSISYDEEQERFNRRQRLAFRKRTEGLLTGSEIQALRARWGLTQKSAATLFGGGPVAFAKYEADEVCQSQAMDRLLRAYDQIPRLRVWLHGHGGVPHIENQVVEGHPEDWVDTYSWIHDSTLSIMAGMRDPRAYRRSLHAEKIIRSLVKTLAPTSEEEPEQPPHARWNKMNAPGIQRRH